MDIPVICCGQHPACPQRVLAEERIHAVRVFKTTFVYGLHDLAAITSSASLLGRRPYHMGRSRCTRWFAPRIRSLSTGAYSPSQICNQTGWGGQPIKASKYGEDSSDRVIPVTDSRRLRVTFAGSVSDVLPWKFTPQQREVRVLPGETALAFYTARNNSEDDIIGIATYSVTPANVAPYFSKIQCFCFEEQRLNAGEIVDMPVFFFIDPDFADDPAMAKVDTITLSYTFFSERVFPGKWSSIADLRCSRGEI